MPRSRNWKPCGALTPADFGREPMWGFDLAREADRDADETWVRPYQFEAAPRASDVLFVAGELRAASGDVTPGAVIFRFTQGAPVVDSLAFLVPRYLPVAGRPGKLGEFVNQRLAQALGQPLERIFPLTYRATVPVGSARVPLEGTVLR